MLHINVHDLDDVRPGEAQQVLLPAGDVISVGGCKRPPLRLQVWQEVDMAHLRDNRVRLVPWTVWVLRPDGAVPPRFDYRLTATVYGKPAVVYLRRDYA